MRHVGWILWLALAAGCDGGGADRDGGREDGAPGTLGDLTVVLEAEETITGGIEAGMTGEAIQDGWDVGFEDYVVVIGGIHINLSTDSTVTAEDARFFAVDLVDVPAAGLPLWSLDGLRTGRWEFNYAISGASTGASRHESVPTALFEEMMAQDWTYLIVGTMTHPSGQSCPPSSLVMAGAAAPNGNTNAGGDACYDNGSITFRFGIQAATRFGPCEIDGVPGFAITEGSGTSVAATIHGDHVFFNGFPESDEGGVMRLAQWLADCDLNLDGEVTRQELEMIAPGDLPEIDARFQLGGSPITPLAHMWDYVTAQVKTQGHFQGEGECPFDGT